MNSNNKILKLIFALIICNFYITAVYSQSLWPCQDEQTRNYGYWNQDSEVIIPCAYEEALDFTSDKGFARVKLNGNYAYINIKGKVVTDWYDQAPEFLEESGIVIKDKKYNVIRHNGKLLYKNWYDYIYHYEDGSLDIVFDKSEWYFMNYKSKPYYGRYEDIFGWNSNFEIMVKKDEEWISLNGQIEETNKSFEEIYHFSNGLSLQFKYNKYGYIDNKGNVVIPFQYNYASSFDNGKAKVILNDEEFYIDTDGNRTAAN